VLTRNYEEAREKVQKRNIESEKEVIADETSFLCAS